MREFLADRIRVAAFLAFAVIAAAAAAQAPQQPAPGGVLKLLPETAIVKREISVGARVLSYVATAGTLPLRDGKGDIAAEIFHVSYVLDPPSGERPVTFVFNGGPGAASAFLHLGGLGPRMIAFTPEGGLPAPPARVVDNPDTWLEMTDLVFVDPVGTGYSRAANPAEEAGAFFGVRQDAEAMAAFIRTWLGRSGRNRSPVHLAGESYGGFRAAILAKTLQSSAGTAPSGLALISPALEFSLLRGDPNYTLLPWALTLPSLASAHLERQGVAEADLPARLAEVEKYALGEYLVQLAAGRRAKPSGMAETVARWTGLPLERVIQADGRVSATLFIKEYERAKGRVLSRYDASIGAPDPNPSNPYPSGPDALLEPAVPVWATAFATYMREELGYKTDLNYLVLNGDVSGRWDFGTSPTRQGFADSLDDLQAARSSNPSLRVLVAHGYGDLVTPYFASRFLIDQLQPLPGAAPIDLRVYGGGHMMYMRPDSRRMLKEDAKNLYK